MTTALPPLAGDVLLAGATGLVGQHLASSWPGPGTLHLLVRRPLPSRGPGPAAPCQVHVVDFGALPALPPAAAAVCCLGTTIKVAGSQAAFRAVDHDAVLAFARAALVAGATQFVVVSSLGADARSRNFYSRVKGEMEAAVTTLGYASVVIARPSLLTGDRTALGQPARGGEGLVQAIAVPLSPLIPSIWRPIAGATVARALLRLLAAPRPGVRVVASAELQDLGR